MRILTAMYTMRRGGAYDRFRMMLEALLERGCQVHCLSLTPIPMLHKNYKNHLILNSLGKKGFAKGIVLFVFPLYALWIGHKEKIDRFVAFGTLYGFIESLAKWILRKPMVTFVRGSFAFGMRTQGGSGFVMWLNRCIERIGIYFSDAIVSVNSNIQEEMRRMAGGRKGVTWKILPNNIPPMSIPEGQDKSEVREEYGVSEGEKILVTAGVIARGKNLELLIRSLPEVGLDKLFLLIVGDGLTEADWKYQMELRNLVDDLHLSNRIVFTGWLGKERLWKIFHGVDAFILPSKSEGMPNVMLEALGCDLICMGSNVPGVEQILIYDELLFDPLDEKGLANKLGRVFSDNQVFSQMRRLCQERKTAFIFDWKEKAFEEITNAAHF